MRNRLVICLSQLLLSTAVAAVVPEGRTARTFRPPDNGSPAVWEAEASDSGPDWAKREHPRASGGAYLASQTNGAEALVKFNFDLKDAACLRVWLLDAENVRLYLTDADNDSVAIVDARTAALAADQEDRYGGLFNFEVPGERNCPLEIGIAKLDFALALAKCMLAMI